MPVTHIPVRIDDDAVRLGRQPHARGRHADRQQPRPRRPPEGARQRERPHRYTIISPALRLAEPRGGLRAARAHARRALPRRHRRDRPADEPGARGGRRERDRALPHRRDPDLHARRRAVEVARRGPHRHVEAFSTDSRSSTSRSGAADGASPSRCLPRGRRPDGVRLDRRRPRRAARAPRPAGGQPELADRPPDRSGSCSSSSPR